jgi:hypothetical protein
MINTNELRKGNKILFENEIIEVVGFIHNCIHWYSENGTPCHSLTIRGGFEPIPLTEDWLLKFGFKQDSDLKNSICRYGIWFNKNNMEATYLSQKLIKIKYVHQLQNLYFALVGEDLTLK